MHRAGHWSAPRDALRCADEARCGSRAGREERFITHTLQLAIQAVLDIASHVVSARRFGEPTTNRNLFDLLEREQWIPAELAARLRDMAGFRNVVVHGYESVDLAVVRDILDHPWATTWTISKRRSRACANGRW